MHNDSNSYSSSLATEFIRLLNEKFSSNVVVDELRLLDRPDYTSHLLPENSKKLEYLPALTQFKNYQNFIFNFAMINFTVPSILKCYLDRLIIKPDTFSYNDDQTVSGYYENKLVTAFIFAARGGFYANKPSAPVFVNDVTLVEACLRFIGFKHVYTLVAEGTQITDEDGNLVSPIHVMLKNKRAELDQIIAEFAKLKN